ncbi:MAG: 3'-5' exonuclease [Aggregatilineales bacterium]
MTTRHHNPRKQQEARDWAQSLMMMPNFYVFDTETTGISKNDEIIQIAVVDKHGEAVINTLIKNTIRISPGAQRVHGISARDLKDAPNMMDVYTDLSIKLAGSTLVAYNMDFDWRMLNQSLSNYRLPQIRVSDRHCAMKEYAKFHGQWNPQRRSYRYQKLSNACMQMSIEGIQTHQALDDTLMTLELIKRMAGITRTAP